MIIEIESLSKWFKKKVAIDNVSLSIDKGVFGLIGKNGAGKTTLLRILATLIPKSEGNVFINGVSIKNAAKIRGMVGYMPQDFAFYPGFSVYDTMKYFCTLSGVKKNCDREISEILEKVDLSDQVRTKVNHLSGGMKRRLGMAVALTGNPSVLLIDEPTVGLDPEERIRFRQLICDCGEEKTVILSTHIIEDVEQTCDKIAIMEDGEIIWNGSVEEAIGDMDGKVWEVCAGKNFSINGLEGPDQICLMSRTKKKEKDVVRFLSDKKVLDDAYNVTPKLEDAYVWKILDKNQ